MNILLEMRHPSSDSVTEVSATFLRKGKVVNLVRGAGGRFGNKATSARTDARIGSREQKAARKVQGGEGLSSVSKAKRSRSTRKGALTSRERTALRQTGGGRYGSEYSNYQKIKRAKSPFATKKQIKRTLKKYSSPAELVKHVRSKVGLNNADLKKRIAMSSGQAKLKKVQSILNKITKARKRRGRRRRR